MALGGDGEPLGFQMVRVAASPVDGITHRLGLSSISAFSPSRRWRCPRPGDWRTCGHLFDQLGVLSTDRYVPCTRRKWRLRDACPLTAGQPSPPGAVHSSQDPQIVRAFLTDDHAHGLDHIRSRRTQPGPLTSTNVSRQSGTKRLLGHDSRSHNFTIALPYTAD